MEEDKKEITEDISREIQESVPKQEEIVPKEVAEKEERIAKAVVEIPQTTREGDDLEKRKRKIVGYLKDKRDWIYYLILAFIMFISVYIRSRNIPKLKDISTQAWILGPDLDPFLFLRWAKDIAENGSLMVWDMMRNVPLGFNTAGEMKLLSYMIVWLHDFLSFFSKDVSVTYTAIVFPVFMAALTAIAFFLFARKIFYKESDSTKNIIALIATALFVVIPSLLPRTIAGIPEKESAAFFFLFMAFYFFLEAFTSKKMKNSLIFGVLAGISTGLMALIWGGFMFIFFIIPTSILLSFIIGKVKKREFWIYGSWLISSLLVMAPFSTRYSPIKLITSTSTGLGIGIFCIVGLSLIIIKINKLDELRRKTKLPKQLFSVIVSLIVILIGVVIFLGPSFLYGQSQNVKDSLIVPISDRFSMTVAENKQPYFANDWKGSFGPSIFKIPLYFWLFFIGSVVLFHNLIKKLNKRERIILTFGYLVFLFCLIFSRYSPNSVLNGISGLSLLMYFGGWLFFLIIFGKIYFNRYKKREFDIFKEFNFAYILYFMTLTLGIIGARGGIRLIMVLGAVSPVAAAFLTVKIVKKYFTQKEETMKFFVGVLALLIISASIFTFWAYYKADKATAENFAPGPYQWQWQKAMYWVRENTQENAVFAHWWDYGYWLQSIGERATILDGGNAIGYWNHFMGRHVLTGDDQIKALEFLYAHNGTHLLIDSTEIGKYTAYSSIGSNEDYDRFSWINTFLMDESQTQETNNETRFFYPGGTTVDEDIIWQENGREIIFPKKRAGIIGVMVKQDQEGKILQPEAFFIYNEGRYQIPLRYIYLEGEILDFETGLEAGVFIFPKLNTGSNGLLNINKMGALMYLSKRTIHSQVAELYLAGKESDYFKLVHTESSLFIENLREQGVDVGEFVQYQGFQGPIKIWEVNYPSGIELNPEFLETKYPASIKIAQPGEYR